MVRRSLVFWPWTLTLRDGLRFHDGTPVLARDVVASLKRWSQRDAYGGALFAAVDALTAPSDTVVQIRLKHPFPLLPDALAKPTSYVWGCLTNDENPVILIGAPIGGLLADGIGIYLDDLFTAANARGTGAGTALIGRLEEIARERGAGVVRWITANDNFVGQKLYDRLASRTMWVTYDLAVSDETAAS